MLSIRIVSAGAVAAIAVVLAVSGATAQTAASDQAGQPLLLLAGLRPPHAAKTHEAKAHEGPRQLVTSKQPAKRSKKQQAESRAPSRRSG